MKLTRSLTDDAILLELGQRLSRQRLQRNLTQAELARQAGVSKRTVERLEAGEGAQWVNVIRLCRALDLIDGMEALIPEPVPSPLEYLQLRGNLRQRASVGVSEQLPSGSWRWKDDT